MLSENMSVYIKKKKKKQNYSKQSIKQKQDASDCFVQ